MPGKIFDNNSVDKLCMDFNKAFKDENLAVPVKISDTETVSSFGMFIEQQLRQIIPNILSQRFPNMPGLEIIKNIDNSGAYLQALIQRIESYQGDYVDVHEIADDKGLLTFSRDGKTIDIRTKRGYSVYDNITAQRAKMYGENIDASLIKVHNIKYQQFLDEMIFLGVKDGKKKVISEGLANYTGVATGLQLNSSSPFATYAAMKDGWGMYAEFEKLYNAQFGASGGHAGLIANTVVLPVQQYSLLFATPIATSDNQSIGLGTVGKYIERNLNIKIYASPRMKGVGDGGSDRLALLNASGDTDPNITLYIPMPLQFLPLYEKAGNYEIHSQFRVAGISINYQECISYLDHI